MTLIKFGGDNVALSCQLSILQHTESKLALREVKDKLVEMQSNYNVANEKCKILEEKRDHFKKECEWTKRQNIKLKGEILTTLLVLI